MNKVYEYIDIKRLEADKNYNDFIENQTDDKEENIEKLNEIIKKDPDFFDTYLLLHDNYASLGDLEKASEILGEGYKRVTALIVKNETFPEKLLWANLENRHIIRMLFNYATFLWTVGEYENGLYVFMQLLKSDNEDNIGARYSIVAILEGYDNIDEFEEDFKDKETQSIENWFNKNVKKHTQLMGWWIDKN